MSGARPSRRRHRPEEDDEEGANHERWLLTYADMITLLMVLFIVLFAISVVDKKKFAELADGLAHNLGSTSQVALPAGSGVLSGGKTANDDQGQLQNNPRAPVAPIDQAQLFAAQNQDANPNPNDAQNKNDTNQTDPQQLAEQQMEKQNLLRQEQLALTDAEEQIKAALKAKGLQNSVSFQITSRGLVVSIVTDQVLFDTGQATLKPIGQEILDAVAPALVKLPNDISIEGHTDNVPISGGLFASNWELSAVRATTVLRYLVSNDGLSENRLSATGYADTKPVAPNDTAAHRQQNRRVEVVVLSNLLSGLTDADGATNSAGSS